MVKEGKADDVALLVEQDKVQPTREALCAAVHQSDIRSIQLFLDRDASLALECDKSSGRTMLHLAAAGGVEAALTVLSNVADSVTGNGWVRLVDRTDHRGMTPLHVACQSGQPAVVKTLLALGASPNLQCKLKFHALHWCCDGNSSDHHDCARELLNSSRRHAIKHAQRATKGEAASATRAAETIDVNVEDAEGLTPLYWA